MQNNRNTTMPPPMGDQVASLTTPAASVTPRPIPTRGRTSRRTARHGKQRSETQEYIIERSPPWLTSAVVHMLGLVVLGLLVMGAPAPHPELMLRYADQLGEQLDEQSIETLQSDEIPKEIEITPSDLTPVDEPLAAPTLIDPTPLAPPAANSASPQPIGAALSGREPGRKKTLLAAYGGDATTEAAVMEGLRWLARNQRRDGLWSLMGPYSNGSNVENRKAATAMALLAFQGAGYTHRGNNAEPFTRIVDRGYKALLQQQEKDGSFLGGYYHHTLYTHAQCTIALCELYGMTRDPALRKPAEKAVEFCIKAQAPLGGWRYGPGTGSDLSVTGWFVMALASAKMAGFEVPSQTLLKVSDFLDLVARENGTQYAYLKNDKPSRSMSAEGLLCRQYLGWNRSDDRLIAGVQLLVDDPVDWGDRDVYYWYYATQVCHHMEGEFWKVWNAEMKRVLPANQQKSGKEQGSWGIGGDPYGPQGGRLYTTCLSIYMLEIYYRHLPLYRPVR